MTLAELEDGLRQVSLTRHRYKVASAKRLEREIAWTQLQLLKHVSRHSGKAHDLLNGVRP